VHQHAHDTAATPAARLDCERLAARAEADYLALFAATLDRCSYAGRGLDGRHVFHVTSSPRWQPMHLTRAAVRRLVGPHAPGPVVARLLADLTAFADHLEFEVSITVGARTVDRACALDDAAAAELRASAGVTR
jgi:hypothetical protein